MLTFEDLIPSATRDRFAGIDRTYEPNHVLRLRGSIQIRGILFAVVGASRLWRLLHDETFHQRARGSLRQSSHADRQGRPKGNLPFRLAGGG